MSNLDPFDEVEEDAWQQITKLERLTNSDYSENTKIDFENDLQELEEIINDLNEAITISEANPQQFNLGPNEINKRHEILSNLQAKKMSIIRDWNAKSSRRTREITSMSNRISQDDANPFSDQNATPDIDDEFRNYQQQEVIRDQDVQLDSIHETMRNLNQQAMIMGDELEDQGMMLDDLDNDLDRVDNRLQRGMKRINWIIEKNRERGSDWCIGILIVALIVLLVLIVVA